MSGAPEPAGRRPGRARAAGLALAGLVGLSLLLGLSCGSAGCEAGALPQALGWAGEGPEAALTQAIVERLRLPRVLAGFAVGGLLALAGALMQLLLRNPLADPYVLGVSGGASLGAVLALGYGLGGLALGVSAWGGAALSLLLLLLIGRQGLRGLGLGEAAEAPSRLLLSGVLLAAGWQALITLSLALAPEARLRGMLFWLIGELSGAEPWAPALAVLALATAAATALGAPLKVMLLGDARAQSLGVPVRKLRLALCLLGAACTAVAVTTAGALGFVGLLVPHGLRLLLGADPRRLLPACALAGGSVVVLADTLARSLLAPAQLPVGALLSLLGVPLFLLLLMRGEGRPSGAAPADEPAPPAAEAVDPGSAGKEYLAHGTFEAVEAGESFESAEAVEAVEVVDAAATPRLQARALDLGHPGRPLLRGLDLSLRPGERWALLGPNGAGKTTLLQALAGLRPPQAGQLELAGRPLADWPLREAACLRGLLPQQPLVPAGLRVDEAVLLGRHPHRDAAVRDTPADWAATAAALQRLGLAALAGRRLDELSGGERQRVALAGLLAQDPLLWLLDEPLAALDLPQQQRLLDLLRERADAGRSLMASFHDPSQAARWASHALLLAPDGRWQAGPAEEVLRAETLSALYGHPLRLLATPQGPVFVPA
ncbi:iron chelate uptake ABC transporter family permease subunit [Aquariibacter lacus]|uniref:iron chelate uptake ABC transporter family permease subunit n=1 Tax=Aquariibacter lacus TaxID=2801332 RepID=UPI0025723079|nr:iron chelate uptake ABC transporter family permease subunit [Piscinibacter lacus]